MSFFKPWHKTLIVMLFDFFAISFSYLASHMLRFSSFYPDIFSQKFFPLTFLIIIITQSLSLYSAGVYKSIWRFSSVPDLIRISKGIAFAIPLSFLFIYLATEFKNFPRSVFIIDAALLILSTGAGRLAYRLFQDSRRSQQNSDDSTPLEKVIIIGAGEGGVKLLRDIKFSPELNLRVVAFIDDDYGKRGKILHGVKVLGNNQDIPSIVEKTNATKAFLAIPSASSDLIRKIISSCEQVSLHLKILPQLGELIDQVDFSQLRDIEPIDLLGREPVDLNLEEIDNLINGKRILITGAGGSIGSELCRQIAKFSPKVLIAFEQTELFLYNLQRQLNQLFPNLPIIPIIGDVRNEEKVNTLFEAYAPEIVFHAAAYKHVPMMEINPNEAVRTNILGTLNVAKAATKFKSSKFVLVSSDKAVNPTNVMGTTKRIAEMICQYTQTHSSVEFITIRFGNVLGSSGSVIPLFKEQIKKGGPVTVTHPEVTRYFMSIPEACQLVIQAGALGSKSDIFVLDMGEPIKIVDLAKDMITLAGLIPNTDIKIEFVGLRPGEKLYEEVFSDSEENSHTPHSKVMVAKVRSIPKDFDKHIKDLLSLPLNTEPNIIKDKLKNLVPEFSVQKSTPDLNKSFH